MYAFTSLNSEASNKSFDSKKKAYKKANFMLPKDIIFDDGFEHSS